MKLVYIAGPYQGDTYDHRSYHQIERNIARAREWAAKVAEAGHAYFCPHLNSAHFEVITPDLPASYWCEADLLILKRCDVLLLLPGAEHSEGSLMELEAAGAWGIPIVESVEEIAAAGEGHLDEP